MLMRAAREHASRMKALIKPCQLSRRLRRRATPPRRPTADQAPEPRRRGPEDERNFSTKRLFCRRSLPGKDHEIRRAMMCDGKKLSGFFTLFDPGDS
jgi:hypothetical protein